MHEDLVLLAVRERQTSPLGATEHRRDFLSCDGDGLVTRLGEAE